MVVYLTGLEISQVMQKGDLAEVTVGLDFQKVLADVPHKS